MKNALLVSMLALTGSAPALAQAPAPWRVFDAAADPAGDDVWANTGTLQGGQAQNFRFDTPQTAFDVNDPIAVGITKAYDIAQTGAARGASWAFVGQAGGGRPNFAENTFEVFFSMADLSGQHVLVEFGGAGNGLSLILDGGDLILASNPGGPGTETTHSVTGAVGTGWQHAVATWNRNTLETSLYINGDLVGTAALAAGTTGWTGGNEAGLGGLTSASVASTIDPAGLTDFDGSIAAFNYYNQQLSAAQIEANFDAVFIPAPSTALMALGGIIGLRRRR